MSTVRSIIEVSSCSGPEVDQHAKILRIKIVKLSIQTEITPDMPNTVDCGIATEVIPNFFAREHIYEYNFQCPEGTTGDYNSTKLISLIS